MGPVATPTSPLIPVATICRGPNAGVNVVLEMFPKTQPVIIVNEAGGSCGRSDLS